MDVYKGITKTLRRVTITLCLPVPCECQT